MRVLVTGGTGFTGTALVHRLLDDGHSVVALDYKAGLQSDALRSRGADVVIGSVTDPDTVRRSMKGMEFVFHLAAAFRELNVPNSFYDEVNVRGTRVVLNAARKEGVRKFVYCSTCGVHGNVDHPPANEDAPIQPADYYQRTKYEAEPLVKREAGSAMETVILRPAAIYGPGDPERFFMIFKRVSKGTFLSYRGDCACSSSGPRDSGSHPALPRLARSGGRPRGRENLQAHWRHPSNFPSPGRLVSAESCL